MWGTRRSNQRGEAEEETSQPAKKQKMPWPPQFLTVEEFDDEMDKAIKEHPPFGEWLLKHRNSNHVLISDGNRVGNGIGGKMGMWDANLEELQAQYVEFEKRRLTRERMPKYFARLHVETSKDDAESAKEALQLAKSAHAEKVSNFEKMQKAGYATDEPGQCPGPNFEMVQHYNLQMMMAGKPRLCECLLRQKQKELQANGVSLNCYTAIVPRPRSEKQGSHIQNVSGTHGMVYHVTTCGVWMVANDGVCAASGDNWQCAGYFQSPGVKITEEMLEDVQEE